jgi:Kef-type K+ transport system membrane component KefB
MDKPANILMAVGLILLLGLATDALGRFTRLPRVTLLILLGVLIGPQAMNLLPVDESRWFPLLANMALVMVGFLLGEKFTIQSLKKHGKTIILFSLVEVIGTALVVSGGLVLFGVRPEVSLLLGAVSTATAPAATTDVVDEYRARGPFSRILLGIVALDDAWGLILFSLMLVAADILMGVADYWTAILHGGWHVGGAFLLGLVLGVPAAMLTGRIKPGRPTLIEALGVVLFCGGIAIWLDVSFLLASMAMGAVVANLARHHHRPFHAIEGIEWPFMILFFVFAGASLEFDSLMNMGFIGVAYIFLRISGRFLSAWLCGFSNWVEKPVSRWMGMALLPQAGVAMGMGLLAVEHFPQLKSFILSIVIGTTIFFELIGPVFTRAALSKVGEIGKR